MTAPPPSLPPKGSRAGVQRERILASAKQCFIEHGFHAASMANIAEAAGMSAGLVYRYVDNKSAIVRAIIEEQLEKIRADIATLSADSDLAQRTLAHVDLWRAADPHIVNPALVLEMSAEATRDPTIAQAIGTSDRQTKAALVDWLSRPPAAGGLGLDRETAASRALLMQCLFDGLAVRTVREPGLDRGELERAIRDFFGGLFAPAS